MTIFPNVPDLPGVPPVLRSPLAGAAILAAPKIQNFLDQFAPNFGVFDKNDVKILNPDSFLSIEYANSRKISSFPVEKGSFANYNKVNNPFSGIIRVAKGGSVSDRQTFLAELQALADSIDLVKLITPEAVFLEVNMESFNYRQEARSGATMIIATCKFIEIRIPGWIQQSGTITTTSKSPSALSKISSGFSSPIKAAMAISSLAGMFLKRGI